MSLASCTEIVPFEKKVPFEDEKVLSYNSVVLRRSDLDLLEGPVYLNDRIIEFYFSYLSMLHPSEDIHFVTPTISFWLANSKDSESFINAFVEPLKTFKVVIFTVNNNDDMSKTDGGTHWSLLVYYRDTKTFVHYDSFKYINNWYAIKLYQAVKEHLSSTEGSGSTSEEFCQIRKRRRKIYPIAAMGPYFREHSTPQQTNGYDCGLYVMAIAGVICRWCIADLKKNHELLFPDIMEHVDNSVESTMRPELLHIIEDLRT